MRSVQLGWEPMGQRAPRCLEARWSALGLVQPGCTPPPAVTSTQALSPPFAVDGQTCPVPNENGVARAECRPLCISPSAEVLPFSLFCLAAGVLVYLSQLRGCPAGSAWLARPPFVVIAPPVFRAEKSEGLAGPPRGASSIGRSVIDL